MIDKIKNNYEHTIYACYIGYITQAIVNNFAPLLFLTFISDYSLTLSQVAVITSVNFFVQLCVDLLSSKFIDKIGYRKSVITAHILSAAGIAGLAVLPSIINVYAGIIVSVVIYAVGGGIIEVLISPIVEACPTERKEAAMSVLHSFYCWGQVAVVLLSTVFFRIFGIANWKILAFIWAVIPLFNAAYFAAVPIYSVSEQRETASVKSLVTNRLFLLLVLLMTAAGASEMAMSQWASAFAESGLKVSKAVGDLAGPCAFAALMGTARALYGKFSDKLKLERFMLVSAILCEACYITAAISKNPAAALIGCAVCGFSVGIFWPGTFSIAAKRLPSGGTAMYALLALAGDLGCSCAPAAVGFAADKLGGNLNFALLTGAVFPLLIIGAIAVLSVKNADKIN